ncbi:hypothetical protein MVI01_18580 [Myxococcus virescens]|uniref:Uncharacterized protein n=1 Tax=Myxococcus virescens TaxID=83456 RepID=A0A511H9G1_9BACT|nr:hypothetical protein MVI01_18580 [Myxococcus virescens]
MRLPPVRSAEVTGDKGILAQTQDGVFRLRANCLRERASVSGVFQWVLAGWIFRVFSETWKVAGGTWGEQAPRVGRGGTRRCQPDTIGEWLTLRLQAPSLGGGVVGGRGQGT